MNQFKLTTQINILFTFVAILACVVFLFVLNLSFERGYENQNMFYLKDYYEELSDSYHPTITDFEYNYESIYNEYFILKDGKMVAYSDGSIVGIRNRNLIVQHIKEVYFSNSNDKTSHTIDYIRMGDVAYMGEVISDGINPKYAVIAVSNTQSFIHDMTGNVPFYTTLAFINILALGMIIIWLWSSSTVKKLKELQSVVDHMVKDNYQTEIELDGPEEIMGLAQSIDNMRNQIKNHEETKKEMIQNLGHDLKTPIAVIKSYAEAILDGIEDKDSAGLIIKQADVLNKKVKQIIEYSKIGYMEFEGAWEDVSVREIVEQVVNHYKYLTSARFIIDLTEDWVHPMIKENFYIAISNIVDNAVRYAQSKIVIQLKSKKLTIYNDGEPIEENILPLIFKAYEKGSKGQFGLGLAIVKETLDRFDLTVSVCNHKNGVLFTIEPQ